MFTKHNKNALWGLIAALALIISAAGAVEAAAKFSITVTQASGGSITPTGTVSVGENKSKVFTMTPSKGNYLSGLTVDGNAVNTLTDKNFKKSGNGGKYTFKAVTANHTLTAAFSAIPSSKPELAVEITGKGEVKSSPGGIKCSDTLTKCRKSFAFGTTVILTASPQQKSVFSDWTGCDTLIGTRCEVDMNANKTVTAAFISEPSGQITVGKITGFGSVFVGGIEFKRAQGLQDKEVSFKFDNSTHPESDLKLGMIVSVTGPVDDKTKTGTYEKIEFNPEARGTVDSKGVDVANGKVTVMGRVVMTESDTVFDGVKDLAELQSQVDVEHRNPELEISGNLDDKGVLHATRVAEVSSNFTSGPAEIKGAITSISTDSFIVAGVRVNMANAKFHDMTASDLAAGLMVEVKGTLSGSVISNPLIERMNAVPVVQPEDNVRIVGTAADSISNNTFTLNGPNGPVTVDVGASTTYASGNASADSGVVKAGASFEVEGAMQPDGSMLATKISLEQ